MGSSVALRMGGAEGWGGGSRRVTPCLRVDGPWMAFTRGRKRGVLRGPVVPLGVVRWRPCRASVLFVLSPALMK
jgi:hypothetical protein